jgi:hypothetical protein
MRELTSFWVRQTTATSWEADAFFIETALLKAWDWANAAVLADDPEIAVVIAEKPRVDVVVDVVWHHER